MALQACADFSRVADRDLFVICRLVTHTNRTDVSAYHRACTDAFVAYECMLKVMPGAVLPGWADRLINAIQGGPEAVATLGRYIKIVREVCTLVEITSAAAIYAQNERTRRAFLISQQGYRPHVQHGA